MSEMGRVLVERSASAKIARTISLDWYDGPRAGFVWLSEPRSGWYFTLWAEAPSSEDVDDRLYALSELPEDAEGIIESALAPLNPGPNKRHWIPDWHFPSEDLRSAADAALDALIERSGTPAIVLRSPDLDHIAGAWHLVQPPARAAD